MLKNRLHHRIGLKNTSAKMILSYFMITILCTSIFAFILYYMFKNTALSVIETDSLGRLSQNINHLKLINSRVFALGQRLIYDDEIIRAVFTEEELTSSEKAKIIRELYNVVNNDSAIRSICLYNAATGEVMDTYSVESQEAATKDLMNLLKSYDVYGGFSLVPRILNYKKSNGDIAHENIITAVFSRNEFYTENKVSDHSGKPLISAVAINLDADSIQGALISVPRYQETETAIIDKKGNIIFDSNTQKFGKNIWYEDYVQSVFKSGKDEDCFSKNINGQKMLIVYKKTNVPEWTFISTYTFHSLFNEIDQLGITMIYISIGILLLALMTSIFTTKTIYSPFKRLMTRVKEDVSMSEKGQAEKTCETLNDVQYLTQTFHSIIQKSIELESSVKDNIPMVKKALLKKLMTGNNIHESDTEKKFPELFKEFLEEPGYYSVVIFSLDEYEHIKRRGNEENIDKVVALMETFIPEVISSHFRCETIDFENGFIYVLIKLQAEESMNGLENGILKKAREDIQESVNYKISCAVGRPVRLIEEIHLSYGNAVDMLKYRLVYGYGTFFSYKDKEPESRGTYPLIDKQKERLIQSIKVCNMNGVDAELDHIFKNISQCQYDYIMITLNQLMLEIVRSVKSFYDTKADELDYNNIYSNLNMIGTLEEMKTFISMYCKSAMEKIERKRMNRKSDLMNEIVQYINAHYNEYELNTESLANMAKLTPGYFGKLFTEITGKTLNEYVIELRLSKACELLKNTSKTINELSEELGFGNPTYFTTLFKKSYGYTPNQYRSAFMKLPK